jgi:hypothetical protein
MSFDRIVVVDWSAHSTPKIGADSIWLAIDDAGSVEVENPATRAGASGRLTTIVEEAGDSTTLIGVDFSLGYPAGTARALGCRGQPWQAMWTLLTDSIVDDGRNGNNRFEFAAACNAAIGDGPGPFWGCPPRREVERCLTITKPVRSGCHPPEWRHVEAVLRGSGRRPFSSWQLLGVGAVGSQTLLGIPVLEQLRRRFPDRVDVWPFTTGLRLPPSRPGHVVVAEIWPTIVSGSATRVPGSASRVPGSASRVPVRDARQVADVATWLRGLDRRGGLREHFEPEVAAAFRSGVIDEEGWVLGVSGQNTGERTGRG